MVVCSTFVNFLDLQCLFVNIFSGTPLIFGVIALLIVAIMGAYFRMITPILGAITLIFAVIFRDVLGPLFWVIIVLGAILLIGGIVKFPIRSG